MEYHSKYFSEYQVSARWSIFNNKEVQECHLFLTTENDKRFFEDQLEHIHKTFETLKKQVLLDEQVIFKRYFLSDSANQVPILNNMERNNTKYTVSIVQQPPLNGGKLALWVYLASSLEYKKENELAVFSHNGYGHFWMGHLQAEGADAGIQTTAVFNTISDSLTKLGCTLKDNCIRTWLYVNDVDINYSDLVTARAAFFEKNDLNHQTHYISSTGIEGRSENPHSLLLSDVYSIRGIKDEQIHYLKAASHLNPTYNYGVTFERGTYIDYGDRRHVFISGTASINNQGAIVHPGNVFKQATRAMENIQTLLAEAEATFDDVAQMIVYLRDISDYLIVNEFYQQRYPAIPYTLVLAPVCRPGWLIEAECIAIVKQNNPQYQNF
jgi:enamine deaminase RidA (YjgF/YER057c/UK114 family)